MLRLQEIRLPLEHDPNALPAAAAARLGISADEIIRWAIVRRGYDARMRKAITLVYSLDVEVKNESAVRARLRHDQGITVAPDGGYRFAAPAPANLADRPVIIGTGPCGLFAGLILAQNGYRPILLERGKAVRERAQDTRNFWQAGSLDPESNVQFGEGGAGTFSDGKLASQIRDKEQRGLKVLDELIAAGAPEEIKYLSKPHVGTGNLVRIVENLRGRIEEMGGQFRFRSRVDDITVVDGRVRGVVLAGGESIVTNHLIVAIGHSARDTFTMLQARGVQLAAKPFSLGLRIEHPQALIDKARFGKFAGHPKLGAADYKLVHHCANGRAVYSFCMCPGGTVLAATSETGCVVTNGMSQYARDAANANGAIVVGVTPADYPGGPLAGIAFQRHYEELAFRLGGGNYHAPGQLVGDFLAAQPSTTAGTVVPSYQPGVRFGDLSACLPDYVIAAIREALPVFEKQIPGFAMHDAVLTGVETRTSSPVRITRDDGLHSVSTRGLFPAGEGAGYAGGIFSSAVDGIKAGEAVARNMMAGNDGKTNKRIF